MHRRIRLGKPSILLVNTHHRILNFELAHTPSRYHNVTQVQAHTLRMKLEFVKHGEHAQMETLRKG